MVRALLAGNKTQTRRICKSQPYGNGIGFIDNEYLCHNDYLPPSAMLMDVTRRGRIEYTTSNLEGWEAECPYGQSGDQLWVRESWMPDPPCDGTWAYTAWAGERIGQIAGVPEQFRDPRFCAYAADWQGDEVLWTPSIHMPRWASRITLEITGVRVERLQDISEWDAQAEGCERLQDDEPGYVERESTDWAVCAQCGGTRLHTALGASGGVTFDVDCLKCDTYVKRYQHLWESINGPGSWDLNPWVWVIEFRRIDK